MGFLVRLEGAACRVIFWIGKHFELPYYIKLSSICMCSSWKRTEGGWFKESDAMFLLCKISPTFGKSVACVQGQNTVWRRYAGRGKKRSWHVIGMGSIMQGVRNLEYFRWHNTFGPGHKERETEITIDIMFILSYATEIPFKKKAFLDHLEVSRFCDAWHMFLVCVLLKYLLILDHFHL